MIDIQQASQSHEAMYLTFRLKQFLYQEAELLDSRQFEQWLDLFADDAIYEIRTRGLVGGDSAVDPFAGAVKVMARDERGFLATRVARLARDLAECEKPPSLTRRQVCNVQVQEAADSDALSVRSNFTVFQSRLNDDWIVGSRNDTLVPHGDTFKIRHRCVTLDYLTLPRTLSIFI